MLRGVKDMKNGEKSVAAVDGLYRSVRNVHADVDFWKVGKLNHEKAVEQSALGPKFRAAATVADSYCIFDDRQVAVVGEEMVKCGKGRAHCAA